MFELKIQTDNAAFEGEAATAEIVRILRKEANRLEHGLMEQGGGEWFIRDINGNIVGQGNWE